MNNQTEKCEAQALRLVELSMETPTMAGELKLLKAAASLYVSIARVAVAGGSTELFARCDEMATYCLRSIKLIDAAVAS